jgi:phenylacetate-CoA ligase
VLNKIYSKSPLFLQNIILNIKGYIIFKRRYNKNFNNYLSIHKKSNNRQIDIKRMLVFLKIANTTPFWNKKFSDFNVDITNINNITAEIKKLPVLMKKDVADNYYDLIPNIKDKTKLVSTSGTTGRKLSFPQTIHMENRQWAIWWRFRQSLGISLHQWCGWFGGQNIVPSKQDSSPYWRTNYANKQVMFSPIHLSIDNAIYYYQKIKLNKLSWLLGYPSQIVKLASYFAKLSLPRIPFIKIITTGAERLSNSQKELISNTFKVPVFQHYGLAEGVANLSQSSNGLFEPDQDFCFTEIIPSEDKDADIYKIIGTNYSNIAFPLIRYDTGDLAKIDFKNKSSFYVKEFLGRTEDYITLANGKRFGPMNLLFKEFKNVIGAQLYYPRKNVLIFKIVKDKNFNEAKDEKIIYNAINNRLADSEVSVKVDYIEEQIKNSSNKIKSIIYN